jgi:hypothetical protein
MYQFSSRNLISLTSVIPNNFVIEFLMTQCLEYLSITLFLVTSLENCIYYKSVQVHNLIFFLWFLINEQKNHSKS